jgi:uncharacterized RDD family membrane protein YckC
VAYEDRLSIVTPEGVVIDLTLAGLGSRIVAQAIDTLIKFAIMLVFAIAFGVVGVNVGSDPTLLVVGFVIFNALLSTFFDVAFEVLQAGRTPGKRAVGIRVVMLSGAPVTFVPSFIRNIIRLIDALPSFYLVGIITMLVSSRNQRLGDIAAGTIVIRDREAVTAASMGAPPPPPIPAQIAAWDVAGVTDQELGAIRRFLERRSSLTNQARYGLANDLAARLRPKVVGAPDHMHPEHFLEWVARVKAARG